MSLFLWVTDEADSSAMMIQFISVDSKLSGETNSCEKQTEKSDKYSSWIFQDNVFHILQRSIYCVYLEKQ